MAESHVLLHAHLLARRLHMRGPNDDHRVSVRMSLAHADETADKGGNGSRISSGKLVYERHLFLTLGLLPVKPGKVSVEGSKQIPRLMGLVWLKADLLVDTAIDSLVELDL